MTTKSRKEHKYDKLNWSNIEERNKLVRARFEKEAHDRERKELDDLRTNYENWLRENHVYQTMK